MVWAAALETYVAAKNVGGATYTGVIWQQSQTNLKSIPDGTSKVYLIGEKYIDQIDYTNSYSGSGDEESLYRDSTTISSVLVPLADTGSARPLAPLPVHTPRLSTRPSKTPRFGP